MGAVPCELVWDNEPGIGRNAKLTAEARAFAGSLATRFVLLKAFDPESKGVVERANRCLETSFLPGRVFASPADVNTQLTDWMALANTRCVRRIAARPADVIEADRAAMTPLPPIAPVIGIGERVRLGRDYCVRIRSNDYSVDPRFIGRFVDVHADLEHVTITSDGRSAGRHVRCWASGQTITNEEYVTTAQGLRKSFQRPRPVVVVDDLHRDLADYDTAFGVTLLDEQVSA